MKRITVQFWISINQDNEFAIFMNRPDTIRVSNGELTVAPVRLEDHLRVDEINFGLKWICILFIT